jgi:hypothetical protein
MNTQKMELKAYIFNKKIQFGVDSSIYLAESLEQAIAIFELDNEVVYKGVKKLRGYVGNEFYDYEFYDYEFEDTCEVLTDKNTYYSIDEKELIKGFLNQSSYLE